jgi:hypothetical protein
VRVPFTLKSQPQPLIYTFPVLSPNLFVFDLVSSFHSFDN